MLGRHWYRNSCVSFRRTPEWLTNISVFNMELPALYFKKPNCFRHVFKCIVNVLNKRYYVLKLRIPVSTIQSLELIQNQGSMLPWSRFHIAEYEIAEILLCWCQLSSHLIQSELFWSPGVRGLSMSMSVNLYTFSYSSQQESHGPHCSPEFKSINNYNYIITLIKRRKKPIIILMIIKWCFFKQNWIPFTQGCFVPSLIEIGPVVLEKKLFKFLQCIFAIS